MLVAPRSSLTHGGSGTVEPFFFDGETSIEENLIVSCHQFPVHICRQMGCSFSPFDFFRDEIEVSSLDHFVDRHSRFGGG